MTKLAAEQLALSYHREIGLPVTGLPPFFCVYGPKGRDQRNFIINSLRAFLRIKLLHFTKGQSIMCRSYTNVNDIVQACGLVVKNLGVAIGEIFNIGTDKTITTGEGIRIIECLLGKPALKVITSRRHGDQAETSANIGKARRVLGYDPIVGIEDGLAQQVYMVQGKKLTETS